jgi:GntR family transcriptional regulator
MSQVYTSCLALCAGSEAGLSELRLGRAERTPLFEAVGAALKREIASGRFAETNVLPGERELSEMLEVSRTTLRRAIAALVDDGVLAHRHGAGTFVRRNPPHVEQPLSRLTSFTEDMRLRGLTASSRVIERGTYLPTPEETMMLGIGPGESVYRLSRLRLADGVPMAIDHAAVPLHFLNGAQAAEESLYAALESSGFRPVRALQRLRAIIIGPAEAAMLEIAAGSAALDIQRIAYLADGRCVEFTRSYYRSDTFDFVAELTLSTTSRPRAEGDAR